MLFGLILENRDLLKAMRPEGSWVMPEALVVSDLAFCLHLTFSDLLQNNIHTYATAFILSPGLSSYRGKVANRLLVSAVFCCWVSLETFRTDCTPGAQCHTIATRKGAGTGQGGAILHF